MKNGRNISAQLTPEQFSFLADFEKQCSDPDISKASIMRCLLRLFENVDVDLQPVRTEDDLLQQSLQVLRESYR